LAKSKTRAGWQFANAWQISLTFAKVWQNGFRGPFWLQIADSVGKFAAKMPTLSAICLKMVAGDFADDRQILGV